jgi:hypothetical protein
MATRAIQIVEVVKNDDQCDCESQVQTPRSHLQHVTFIQ